MSETIKKRQESQGNEKLFIISLMYVLHRSGTRKIITYDMIGNHHQKRPRVGAKTLIHHSLYYTDSFRSTV